MSIISASIFVILFGSIAARQTNIDINGENRVKHAPLTASLGKDYYRRSVLNTSRTYRSNDYDDYSGGLPESRTPVQFRYPAPPYPDAQAPIKVYQPREDPRLFYQSDEYLKEILGKNVNYDVTNIYPGREVVRMGDRDLINVIPARLLKGKMDNRVDFTEYKHCVKCPRDKTIIARAGYDRVLIQSPRLLLCSGRKAPKNVRFAHYFGPKFGTLLEGGTYSIVGRIMYKNENLQMCKFKIHIIIQTCPTPPSLVAQCKGSNQLCYFNCRDTNLELIGATSLICGDDLQWDDSLPTCRARSWCKTPAPPEHGRISCKGHQAGKSNEGLAEGSRCRVRCDYGWRSNLRIVAFCRRGNWTRPLECESKNST